MRTSTIDDSRMEGSDLKSKVLLSFVILSLLVMSLQTTDVAANQSLSNESLIDNQVPIVNSPLDIIYVEGGTGYSITWIISDDNPAYWITTRNGEILSAIPWDALNETVIVDVDGLSVGNYEFKIYVCDDIHNITDVVLVSVLSTEVEVHAPVSIYGDIQFNDTVQSEGWVGNGSAISPYIIENLYIEAISDCISIHGTTAYFIIRNCTFVKPVSGYGVGLDLQSLENGIIKDCTFSNLWVGCIAWSVSSCTWESNSFGNLDEGIWLTESTNCAIDDNTFMSGGISITGKNPSNWIHDISGNVIAEKPIGYFEGLSTLDIDVGDYGQIIVTNCSEVDIFNGDFSDVGTAISIAHSNFSSVSDCDVQEGRIGIYVERTNWIDFDNCHLTGMSEIGFAINETIWTTVSNCTVENIGYSGFLIVVAANTTIWNSVIKNCGDSGVACFESPYFYLLDSTIEQNGLGVYIGGCPESQISYCEILRNTDIGLYIGWDCEGTYVIHNDFGLNMGGNAYDDGTSILWDAGPSHGNSWSDYGGSGYYYVPGSGNGIDHYPTGWEFEYVIEVFDTADTSYTVDTMGHYIVWETNCTHPSMYSIFQDGVLKKQEAWSGSTIVYNIDGLAVGEYNFTLEIWDEFGATESDTVIVIVNAASTTVTTTTSTSTSTSMPTTAPPTTSNTTSPIGLQEFTFIISIGSTVVIIVMIILMLRTRRSPL